MSSCASVLVHGAGAWRWTFRRWSGPWSGVNEGQRVNFGVKTRLIGIFSRTYGVDIAARELDALADLSQ